MSSLRYDPPLSENPGIVQTVSLIDDGDVIATARWHTAADEPAGVAQLLDFNVDPAHGRRGNGRRLMAALVEQCVLHHRAQKKVFRRLWLTLHHKRHVIARAFFLSQGFTHTTTIKDVTGGGDLLVYVRTFD